jgi:hypothetical protein
LQYEYDDQSGTSGYVAWGLIACDKTAAAR